MFIPLSESLSRRLERRKGGGGSAKGGSGSEKSGSSSEGSSGEDESGSTCGGEEDPIPLSMGEKTSASAYGYGGGQSIIIPAGQLFAGRSAGGGTRDQIYGTRTYGSGYPGVTGRGVTGRGFPFWFWPMVWGSEAATTQSYLNGSEYGDGFNTSRVGGPLMEATFVSNNSDLLNTTLHILSDNTTIISLIDSIDLNCSSHLSSSSSKLPSPFNISSPSAPQPEQAIQYYRASSAVLTLDEYNNSATLSSWENTPDSPLPPNIDIQLLDCLNQTIGLAMPLVNGCAFLAVPRMRTLVLLATIVPWVLSLL